MSLKIVQAKPNPAGKDRERNVALKRQLAGEWVDVRNVSNAGQNLSNISLYHCAYTSPKASWKLVMSFSGCGTLPAGKVVRIHSSGQIPVEQLLPVDKLGADYHLFSGSGYVWNNANDDYPMLWNSAIKKEVDRTHYTANPTEGKILSRLGDVLI